MKKKLMAGAITLLSVATLAACSNSSEGKDLISMKGDVITEHQFFEEVKNNPTAQQVLLNMTIQKVFEQQYGSEVTDKDVDDAVAEEQKKYGDSYNSVLQRAGMTPETRKAQIRTSKLVELAVKKAAESELTDEAYQKAFESYTPDVTAQIIRLDNEDKAKEVLEKAKAEGADFAQLAKDNSNDDKTKENGGRVFSVGTTSTRTLETIARDNNGKIVAASGWTNIFIYPGFEFKCVDGLITNFHLPKSSLIMLVSAFYDREKVIELYNIAVENKYRFFSFGDAMIII